MAKTDTLNIRVEPKLKKEVETTLNDLGMNIAEAVTIFFKQIVMNEGIPFEIRKPRFNKETIEAIEETEKIMKDPDSYKTYNNIKEIMEELDCEDE
ncbi:MAG: type II toxin-antitoxin system RelB/DinJ family antitoxin [Clostridia bacterium]|nr:type II toxin-antitoxin system RelB/DinJ family antitoxin [Clostridia bacterium]